MKTSFVLGRFLQRDKSNIENISWKETKRKENIREKTKQNKIKQNKKKKHKQKFFLPFSLFTFPSRPLWNKTAQYFDHFLFNKACLLIAFKKMLRTFSFQVFKAQYFS